MASNFARDAAETAKAMQSLKKETSLASEGMSAIGVAFQGVTQSLSSGLVSSVTNLSSATAQLTADLLGVGKMFSELRAMAGTPLAGLAAADRLAAFAGQAARQGVTISDQALNGMAGQALAQEQAAAAAERRARDIVAQRVGGEINRFVDRASADRVGSQAGALAGQRIMAAGADAGHRIMRELLKLNAVESRR